MAGVVGEPAVHFAVDRDVVVVVQRDQLAELERAGERAGLVRDAFHQAAVTEEHPGGVIDHIEAGAIEAARQHLFGKGETHGIRQTLAERTGGGFHARRFMPFGVARGPGMQLAEALEFIQRQVVAGQMQQGIVQHRTVAVAQHEAIAVRPGRIGRVVTVKIVPHHFGDVGHAHGHAGMTALGGLHCVCGEETDGVGEVAAAGGGHGRRVFSKSKSESACSSSTP
jgi:hypothetical protein